MVPSLTAKPAKGMIASLGTGMQALSSSIRKKTAGQAPVADEGGRPLDERVDDGLHHARQRTVPGAGRANSAAHR